MKAGIQEVVFLSEIKNTMPIVKYPQCLELYEMNLFAVDNLSGKQFELFLQELLPSLGFTSISQTKKTGDYGADLLAEYCGKKYAIQAKRYKRPVGLKAIQEANAAKSHYKADCAMVVTNSAFTVAALNLAKSCQCDLIDRDVLQDIIGKKFQNYDELIDFLSNNKVVKYKISNQELIDAYFKLKHRLNCTSVTVETIDSLGDFASSVYRKRWGSWNKFLKSINEPLTNEKNISKDRLVEEFNIVKDRLKKNPTRNEIKRHSKFSVSTYERSFGTWNNFLNQTTGLLNKRNNIDEKEFINEFNRVKRQLGHVPTVKEMYTHGKIAPTTYRRIWGSWSNFLKERKEPFQKRNIPRDELIKAYLKLKKQLKKESITQFEMDEYGDYSSSVYIRHFGSWNKFLIMVGDKLNSVRNIPSEDLIEDYYRVKEENGVDKCSANIIRIKGKYSLSTYLKRFGTWNKFLKHVEGLQSESLMANNEDNFIRIGEYQLPGFPPSRE